MFSFTHRLLVIKKILWLHDFLGLNNKLKNIYTLGYFHVSCLLLWDHILFSSNTSKLCLFSYYHICRSCFHFSDISSKSLYAELFLHFKQEFHKFLQACFLIIWKFTYFTLVCSDLFEGITSPFLLSMFRHNVCMHNASYILKENFSKLCILASCPIWRLA